MTAPVVVIVLPQTRHRVIPPPIGTVTGLRQFRQTTFLGFLESSLAVGALSVGFMVPSCVVDDAARGFGNRRIFRNCP